MSDAAECSGGERYRAFSYIVVFSSTHDSYESLRDVLDIRLSKRIEFTAVEVLGEIIDFRALPEIDTAATEDDVLGRELY